MNNDRLLDFMLSYTFDAYDNEPIKFLIKSIIEGYGYYSKVDRRYMNIELMTLMPEILNYIIIQRGNK